MKKILPTDLKSNYGRLSQADDSSRYHTELKNCGRYTVDFNIDENLHLYPSGQTAR